MGTRKVKSIAQAAEALKDPYAAQLQGEVDEFVKMMTADASAALDTVQDLEVIDNETYVTAGDALKAVAHRHDTWNKKRLSWVGKLKEITSDIDKSFRPVLQALAAAEDDLRTKVGAWSARLELARQEKLKASLEAKTPAQAEKLYAEAGALVAPELNGVSTKIVWRGEVIDADALPREYLMPDVKKLETVTKAMEKDPAIPGWKAFPVGEVDRIDRKGA